MGLNPGLGRSWKRNFLEKEMAPHSSILAWKTPWREEPGGLQSIGSQRVGHDLSDLAPHWTVAHQVPLSMEFSRQEYWSGLPFPMLENLPNPGMEPMSLVSPALAGGFFTTEPYCHSSNSFLMVYIIEPHCL